ncbi:MULTISPECIES: NAD-dependent epimerase/dehydratase family protein [unclassified Mesorhizobium]|uniref:NAD-dependent epimerase/dehydratase family protein n=1 Tax=unclassified Mesorhizobium TaxID=325217 RepID=UPI000967E09A|nr:MULTISPECIES: NAD-dependent epimerase/dehydratase family protein [unclassified Mesorhizobium]MBN9258172.1 NAD-dependent epimerase/dehydratase family protein [Mesorhizobium sp.]OJX74740.1 MAG: UDP-glucose 4-epimerase [Mesorhizobium sp. 65-26]
MARSVLVSGGCGFIGSHIVDRLLLRGDLAELVVVDNLWTGSRSNLAHVKDARLRVEVQDVENFTSAHRFDEIIHLASPASPPWYMRDPARTIRANVVGALNLLGLLKPGGRFSFASTSEVYGDPAVSPQPESYRGAVDCTGPRSSYDESKRCTEALLFETRRVSGLDVRVARLFNTYGPRMRIDDGRAVSNFIVQALTTGALTVHGDGSQSRSWGYVDDVIEGLERFFWRDRISPAGPVNIGNDIEVPVIEIANYVRSLVPGSRIEYREPAPHDPSNRCPDLTMARQLMPGWRAGTTYQDGIRRTFEWFREQLAAPSVAVEPGPREISRALAG